MYQCQKGVSGWIGRGRDAPPPPLQFDAHFIFGPLVYALLSILIFLFCGWLFWRISSNEHEMERVNLWMMSLVFLFGLSCSVTDTVRMVYCWKYGFFLLYEDIRYLKMTADFFYFCMTSSLQMLLTNRVRSVSSEWILVLPLNILLDGLPLICVSSMLSSIYFSMAGHTESDGIPHCLIGQGTNPASTERVPM